VNIEDHVEPQNINLTSTVKVEAGDDRKASITIPPELRLTPQLLELLNQALQAQGLALSHLNISEEHKADVGKLPNVVLEESPAKPGE